MLNRSLQLIECDKVFLLIKRAFDKGDESLYA